MTRKARVWAERKHITVLSADVAGSMDLQERLDAELWAAIMGRFVSILTEGVRKFGAMDKFTGADHGAVRGPGDAEDCCGCGRLGEPDERFNGDRIEVEFGEVDLLTGG